MEYHIVGMSKYRFIVFLGALILTACASQAPLDDAYHWMDKAEQMAAAAAQTAQQSAQSATSSSSSSSSSSTSSATPTAPSLEYTNVQDTTITVRIKR